MKTWLPEELANISHYQNFAQELDILMKQTGFAVGGRKLIHPDANGMCPCGSGQPFNRCCHLLIVSNRDPLYFDNTARKHISNANYKAAVRNCRASISAYYSFHLSNTIHAQSISVPLYDKLCIMDTAALSDHFFLLINCFVLQGLTGMARETLYRSCDLIQHHLWVEEVKYLQCILCVMSDEHDGAIHHAKQLENIYESHRPKHLCIYLDLLSDELDVYDCIRLAESITKLDDDPESVLAYGAQQASWHGSIGSDDRCCQVLKSSIELFESRVNHESLTADAQIMYLTARSMLAKILPDVKLGVKCLDDCKQLLNSTDCTEEIQELIASLAFFVGDYNLSCIQYQQILMGNDSDETLLKYAMALAASNNQDECDSVLSRVNRKSMTPAIAIDFAYATIIYCHFLKTDPQMVIEAKSVLSRSQPESPIQSKHLLLVKQTLEEIDIGSKSKFLDFVSLFVLQPSFMGIGVNINKIFESILRKR